MNPQTNVIVPRHTGRFQISPVGRVGSYEKARATHRCRKRKYWIIEEELPEVRIVKGEGWESRTKHEKREDLGKFPTKQAAIDFMVIYAAVHPGVILEGNLKGYPQMIISRQIPDEVKRLVQAFRDLLTHAEQHTCLHEETKRGGGIWEICTACGMKWADDQGGKPANAHDYPPVIVAAQKVADEWSDCPSTKV